MANNVTQSGPFTNDKAPNPAERIFRSDTIPRLYTFTDRPLVGAALVLLVYGLYVLLRLYALAWDSSNFVVPGRAFVNANEAPAHLHVNLSTGYDGQFCYRLALKPWTHQVTEFGLTIDNPPYRQQRIVYPALVYLISYGHTKWAQKAMILVNLLALGAMAWAGGSIAATFGRHALWGSLLALYPGFLLSLTRDLTEIVQAAFLVTAVLCLRKARPGLATAAVTLALLTREIALFAIVAALPVYFVSLAKGRWGLPKAENAPPWYFVAVPVLIYAVWQVTLRLAWGSWPAEHNHDALGLPFVEFARFFAANLNITKFPARIVVIECLYMILVAGAGIAAARGKASLYEKTGWLFYATLAVFFTQKLLIDDWGYLRSLTEFFLFTGIVILGAGERLRFLYGAATILLWLALSSDLLMTLR